MAFTTRSKRDITLGVNSTGSLVGPGSYDTIYKHEINHGYVLSKSSISRSHPFADMHRLAVQLRESLVLLAMSLLHRGQGAIRRFFNRYPDMQPPVPTSAV